MLEGEQADGGADDGAGSIFRGAGPRTQEADTRGAEVAGVEAGADVFAALQNELFANCPRMAGPDLREARTAAASSAAVDGEAMERKVPARQRRRNSRNGCYMPRMAVLSSSGQGCATAASTRRSSAGLQRR
jgi:hypothetical protein